MGRPRKYQRVEDVPLHEGGHHLRQFDPPPVGASHNHSIVGDASQAAPVESLGDFIARHEAEAMQAGLVVTRVTYPGAQPRIYPGKYAGIRLQDGPLSARYSDGSTH